MGIINHNCIIGVTDTGRDISGLMAWIQSLPPPITKLFVLVESDYNGTLSLFLAPDGGKEGWEFSNQMDLIREELIRRLGGWSWVEVGFGEYGQRILDGNNSNLYSEEGYYGN